MALRNPRVKERLSKFTEENAKLQKDVEKLEDALALHNEISKADKTSVKGILRKEIGGSRWQHGGKGTLKGYSSAKQLTPEINSSQATKKGTQVKPNLSKAINSRDNLRSNQKTETGSNLVVVNTAPYAGISKTANHNGILKHSKTDSIGDPEAKTEKFSGEQKRVTQTSDERIAAMKKKVIEKAAKFDFYSEKPKTSSRAKFGGKQTTKSEVRSYESDVRVPAPTYTVQHSSSAVPVPPLWTVTSENNDFGTAASSSLQGDPQVVAWLHSLNLKNVDKYIQIFSEHEIDLESVKLLSESQLKEMGITALGTLNKLLFAISEIRGEDLNHQILTARTNVQMSPSSASSSPRNYAGISELAIGVAQAVSYSDTSSKGLVKPKKVTEKHLSSQLWNQKVPKSTTQDKRTKAIERRTDVRSNSRKEADRKTESKKVELKGTEAVVSRPDTKKVPIKVNAPKTVSTGVEAATRRTALQKKKEEALRRRELSASEAKKKARDEMAARHAARLAEALEMETAELAKKYQEQLDSAKAENLEDVLKEVLMDNPSPREHPTDIKQSAKTKNQPRARSSMAVVQPKTMEITGTNLDTPHQSSDGAKNMEQCRNLEVSKPLLNDLEQLEIKVKSLQEKGHEQDGDFTPGLIDNLQKQLTTIQQQVQHMNAPAQSSRPPIPQASSLLPHKEHNLSKNRFHYQPGTRASVSHSGNVPVNLSLSKQQLLKEVRKQKDDHRKHIRHLESELSRLKHKDPVKTCELPPEDLYYDQKDKIGEGAFSQVFRGSFQGSEVAIKRLKVPLVAQDKNYFAAEVSLLHELRHPRVVLLLGVCTKLDLPLMVLEYMTQGSLYSALHDYTRPSLDHVAYYQIARDTALGMNYLHRHKPPVLHLDLKSMNVLLGSHGRAKIADFGFSKLRHEAQQKASQGKKSPRPEGTPAWMAPELLDAGEVTTKADVYSFGIILWEMLTRDHPYKGCSMYQILERTRTNKRPVIPESSPDGLRGLINKCWNSNPACRPSFKDVVSALENLSFPPEWQVLLSAAGIPKDAMDDIQSARNIITLVNETLEAETRSHSPQLTASSKTSSRNQNVSNRNVLYSSERDFEDNPSLPSHPGMKPCPKPDDIPALNLDSGSAAAVTGILRKSTNRVQFSNDYGLTYRQYNKPTVEPDLHLGDFKFQSSEDSGDDDGKNTDGLNIHPSIKLKDSYGGDKESAKTFRASAWHDELERELAEYSVPAPPPLPSQFHLKPAQTNIEVTMSERLKPKLQTTSDNQEDIVTIKSTDLIRQRLRLQPTADDHPCQLKDLKGVSEDKMSSLADVLRKAVAERRPAMTYRDDYSQGDSGWSAS